MKGRLSKHFISPPPPKKKQKVTEWHQFSKILKPEQKFWNNILWTDETMVKMKMMVIMNNAMFDNKTSTAYNHISAVQHGGGRELDVFCRHRTWQVIEMPLVYIRTLHCKNNCLWNALQFIYSSIFTVHFVLAKDAVGLEPIPGTLDKPWKEHKTIKVSYTQSFTSRSNLE